MKIPTKEECLKILELNKVLPNIVAHVNCVHDFSMKVCDILDKRKIKANRKLVAAAALLHDVYKLKSNRHELDGADYVESLGYKEVAGIIRKHGLINVHEENFQPKTWEEKIVFYSDKRCKGSAVVSVDERFEYIKQRYFGTAKDLNRLGRSKILQTDSSLQYLREIVEPEIEFTKKLEKELLGEEKID